MEYTISEKCFIVGAALSLANKGHRRDIGELMNNHPDIFKNVISDIVTGIITYDYEIKNAIIKLAREIDCNVELVLIE